ncbi:MAG: NADH-quinone oxidoreductase subunit H [Chloroflexi bacterium]|nr:NADH-quinone oxidoreductase subunit H [Chloroflexota bacterium]
MLQPFADALKILSKEAITPRDVDKWVFWVAPAFALVPAMLVYGVIPWGPGLVMADLSIGVLFILAVSSLHVVPVFMAGWSSNNKYSLLGAMRAVAQMVSYEIPQVLSLVGMLMLVGSMRLTDIVNWQAENTWLILVQPLACLMFFIAASAELNRTPTDIVEGESEIIGGYHTEYSSFKFIIFYIAEYASLLAVCGLLTIFFFGGWTMWPLPNAWQILPSWLVFITKLYFFFGIFVWVRATLPRLRSDQLMAFAWKFLLPLSLMNIGVTAVEIVANLPIPVMVVINMALALALIWGWAGFLGGNRKLGSTELRERAVRMRAAMAAQATAQADARGQA